MDAEKEILLNETYQQFLQFGLGNLPIELYETIVAENYMGYGTALDEKLFSAIDLRDLVIRQMEQAQGMDMKFAEIPVFRRISVSEDVAIIVAEILVNIQVESSRHDLFVRMTTVMEFMNGKWIAVHSHGSKPEAAMGESDTWHINEWKRKNEELQRLVDEKTADLSGKNQELVIEACLERVRAQALSMREPADMLEVCRVISEQLTLLGVREIRNVQTAIIFADKGNYLNFEYYRLHDKKFITEVDYTLHKEQAAFANQMMSGPEAFHETHFSGKELSEWVAYQSTTNQFVDPYLYTAESLNYYFYSMGPVALGVSTYAPLKTEDLLLVKRFRNVFELAYTRFLDIQQAQVQAREAQIEVALEKIRSRSLAMHRSEELKEVIHILFEKLNDLKVLHGTVGIQLFDQKSRDSFFWVGNDIQEPQMVNMPYNKQMMLEDTFLKDSWQAMAEGRDIINKAYTRDQKNKYFEYLFSNNDLNQIPEVAREIIRQIQTHIVSFMVEKNSAIFTDSWNEQLFSNENLNVIKRAAKVFEQAYIRFLDLQKAETQARDAEIELALERVRARTMAMQHSDELQEAANLLFQQVHALGIPAWSCGYNIWDKSEKEYTGWMSTHGSLQPSFKMPLTENPTFIRQYESRQKGELFYAEEVSGQALVDHYKYMQSLPDFKPILERFLQAGNILPESQVNNIVNFSHGNLIFLTSNSVPESWDIFKRFAKVFEQTYTRFLDLQKAEKQARDAQIELALERVRARTMAMQKSYELREVVAAIYEQLQHLGFTYGACSIVIMDKITGDMIWWISGFGKPYPESYHIPFFDHPFYLAQLNNWKEGKKFAVIEASGEVKKSYDEIIFSQTEFVHVPEETRKVMMAFEKIIFSNAYMKHGALSWGVEPLHDEHAKILQRFAIVFEQTYTRFLDLQKAEAQAREAHIEAALERVRSRAMAMQKSSELSTLIELVYKEMGLLDFVLQRCFIMIFDPANNSFTWWMASNEAGSSQRSYLIPYHELKPHLSYINGWKEQNPRWMYILKGAEKDDWDAFLFKKTELAELPPPIIENMTGTPIIYLHSSFSHFGCICAASVEPLEGDYFDIINRFSKVFDQTYTRFLDLQNAEAQARDAQVEAALEKVRSRTMAMQKSDELADAAYVLFQQLNHLGVIHERINIGIVKEETKTIDFWITEQGGNQINTRFSASLKEPTTISPIYAAWKAGQKSMIVDLTGEDLKAWLKYLTEVIGIPFDPAFTHNRRVQTAGSFSKGMLVLTTPEPLPEESIHLLEKFAGVFDLTYTRFNDLLMAEAQTQKANIEVALERVRARALAMQEPEELIEVAEVLRHEMGLLGVEELETSSIYLHDDKSDTVECWYAISDLRHPEKKLVADQINIDLQKTWVGRQMFDFYESDKNQISILMQGANRIEWIKYCASVSTVLGDFYGESIPDRTYHLYKFSNGAIGAASAGDISPESWELLSRTASVFSLAYSRFRDLTKARIDLQKLKEEKQRAELALTDLKAAQAQLVQAEKMASLGELTAGIAHEIQNPLNFVNNFSELSNELIEEMQEEMDKGNSDEVKNIVADIRSNLEKINLHGKRADAIVKGMLQHSRTTSGEKQPTDINALAEEYLRLAYHGLRAKDKNFNVILKTEFDSAVGNINIIPQDIGRVLLNLINNAFYAVSEKQKREIEGFEPVVIISTKKLIDKVQIEVRDNGNGIPENIYAKIFQPFFTTKPTGLGTGLGLSLSYDSVKAHGGELKVETKEGEGSNFIIQLPIN